MAGFYGIDSIKEVIRVHVKKYDGQMQPESKKFSIDPQITSFEMLQNLLAKAFDIKSDFTISYLSHDAKDEGYLTMLSDWDIDAAFQNASDPCLQLKVDLKPFDVDVLEDWDIIVPVDIPQIKMPLLDRGGTFLGNITGTISNGVGKTVSRFQQVMGLKIEDEEMYLPLKNAMTDMEFRNYQDSDGHIIKSEELRLSIYQGGIEPSLRRVVWRHLLNIFPKDMSGKERFDYMKKKENEYVKLRERWRGFFSTKQVSEEAKQVALLVKKDVLRTDRTHKYYSGADDSKNLHALYNLLVTYALTHPEISYCQGMSDIASPLLVVQNDEAQAYLCFCGLMGRLRSNFMFDGTAITTKLQHLSSLVKLYDPTFHTYLNDHGADDLFFCYRWLLLEMKREFPFDDALYMLEVMWSTIPPSPPEVELQLADEDNSSNFLSISPHLPYFCNNHNQYAHLLSKRKISGSCKDLSVSKSSKVPNSQNQPVANGLPTNTEAGDVHGVMGDNERCMKGTVEHSTIPNTCSTVDKNGGTCSLHSSQCFDRFPTLINVSIEDKIPVIDNEMVVSSEEVRALTNTVLDETIGDNDLNDQTGVTREVTINGINICHLSEPENINQPQCHMSLADNGFTPRKGNEENIPQIKGSFFINMKKLLSSPQRKPREQQMRKAKNLLNLSNDYKTNTNVKKREMAELNGKEKTNMLDQENTCFDTNGEHTLFESNGTMKKIVVADENINGDYSETEFGISASNHPQMDHSMIQTQGPQMNHSMIQTQGPQMNHSIQNYKERSVSKPIDSILQEDEQCLEICEESMKEISKKNTKVIKNCVNVPSFYNNYFSINSNISSNAGESKEVSAKDDMVTNCIGSAFQDVTKPGQLPALEEFGYGNPFLMFICLTVLLQHRDVIVNTGMQYDELAMLFDKMVRKHKVNKVLHQARHMYTEYIKKQHGLYMQNNEHSEESDFKV